METGMKRTTAGVMFWTPAPARVSSPGSSAAWEDEEVEAEGEVAAARKKADEDFHSLMDENGIIGLTEASEGAEQGRERDGDGELSHYSEEPLTHSQPPGEDAHTLSNSLEAWTEDEELRQGEDMEEKERWLLLRQSLERFPERDAQLDMTEDEREVDEDEEDELVRNGPHEPPWRGTAKIGGEPELLGSRTSSGGSKNFGSSEHSTVDLIDLEGHGASFGAKKKALPLAVVGRRRNLSPYSPSAHPHQDSRPPSTPGVSPLPHLLHFSSEELTDAPGIDAEVFPVTDFTESLPESQSSRLSHAPESYRLLESEGEDLSQRTSPYSAATSPRLGASHGLDAYSDRRIGASEQPSMNYHLRPTPSRRKSRRCSPHTPPSKICSSPLKAWPGSVDSTYQTNGLNRSVKTPSPSKLHLRSPSTDVEEARRSPLSYRTPDFSKVEPRVHFPKSGYTPPKSRGSPRKRSPSVEPPLVFKSPADIVREVLLSGAEGAPPPSLPSSPRAYTSKATIPEEFKCPQQATTLVHQLQEDYNRLLTKYAAAENTIDRLRLEAKVNLYSDLPKPHRALQSGLVQGGSKVMTLNFPQAQRAEFTSGSVQSNGQGTPQAGGSPARPSSAASSSSRRSALQFGQQLAHSLSTQVDAFQQQIQAFEDRLKGGRLKPLEQMEGISQLVQGLDSLERGYLAARNEHTLLQRRGAQVGPFDPNRELEGRVFQCGIQVEELKELVEQVRQDRPSSEAPPTPLAPPTPPPTGPGRREPTPLPESPVSPVPGLSAGPAAVEVSSVSGDSDGGMEEEEEELPSLFLRPLDQKQRLVEQDYSALLDQYQSFKEWPSLLDLGLGESGSLSPGGGDDQQLREVETDALYHRKAEEQHQDRPPQRRFELSPRPSPRGPTTKQRTGKSDASSPRDPAPPDQPSNENKRRAVGRSQSSSLTSLGESALSERRGSKLQPGSSGMLSQDGLVSPETDSGFVGSDVSRLTPGAVPSPLHQRASASRSVPPGGRPDEPPEGSVPGGPVRPASSRRSASSSARSGGSRLSDLSQAPGPSRRCRRTERRGPAVGHSPPHWTGSGTSSGFEPDSDCPSGVEGGQSDRHAGSTDPRHGCGPSPSPVGPRRHGDPLGARSPGQLTNHDEALQRLQSEVSRLTERLSRCLVNPDLPGPVQPPPAGQGSTCHPLPASPHIRSGNTEDSSREERRHRRTIDKQAEGSATGPVPRGRPSSVPRPRPQPDSSSQRAPSTSRASSSKYTPVTSTLQDHYSNPSNPVPSRPAATGWRVGPSAGRSEPVDEPDYSRGPAPLCPQCSAHCTSLSAQGGVAGPTHAPLRVSLCPMCGQPQQPGSISKETDRRKGKERGHTHRDNQPTGSPQRDVRGGNLAVPAPPVLGSVPLVQCVPVCPSHVLYYSPVVKTDSYPQPLYVSVGGGATSSGAKGHTEVRGHHRRRSPSADGERYLRSSLDRAIRAARDMKHTSKHMARSLAEGLCYQEALSQI